MIRLVVSDVDGTLLGSDGSLEAAKQLSGWLRQRGILFTIATGRVETLTTHLVEQLDIDIPYIVTNGATIMSGDATLQRSQIPLPPLRPLIEFADKKNLSIIYSTNGVESTWRTTGWVWEEYRRLGISMEEHRFTEEEWRTRKLDKLTIMDEPYSGAIHEVETICRSLPDTYTFTRYLDRSVEVVSGTATKAAAIRVVADRCGVSMDEVLAVGDHQNDIEMIREAGIGVAVANAIPSLKQAADYVATGCGAQGILEAVEKFCS